MLGVTLVVVSLFVRLAYWQQDRAAQKQAIYQNVLERRTAPVITDSTVLAITPPAELLWRRARLAGQYWPSPQILLDNQVHDGRAGYHVLAPFALDNGDTMLVDRGWIPIPDLRSAVPDLPTVAGPATAHGILAPPPASGIRLSDRADRIDALNTTVIRVQRLDPTLLASYVSRLRLPPVLYLDANETGALITELPEPGDRGERQQAYALLWLIFAGLTVGAFVVLNFDRRAHE
jgi:surfeit locus 1 family protein